jgi:hypothetical protein
MATTFGLASVVWRLDALADMLGAQSVLVMRSDPDSMVVAATAGPVRGADGEVVGTVCVLDDHPRDYDEGARRGLDALRTEVEAILARDASALAVDGPRSAGSVDEPVDGLVGPILHREVGEVGQDFGLVPHRPGEGVSAAGVEHPASV